MLHFPQIQIKKAHIGVFHKRFCSFVVFCRHYHKRKNDPVGEKIGNGE